MTCLGWGWLDSKGEVSWRWKGGKKVSLKSKRASKKNLPDFGLFSTTPLLQQRFLGSPVAGKQSGNGEHQWNRYINWRWHYKKSLEPGKKSKWIIFKTRKWNLWKCFFFLNKLNAFQDTTRCLLAISSYQIQQNISRLSQRSV